MIAPAAGPLRLGAGLSLCASLLWPLQAGCAAWVLGEMAHGRGRDSLIGVLGFVVIAVVRSILDAVGNRIAQRAALGVVRRVRHILAAHIAPDSNRHIASGAWAALGSDKIEALLPYLTRYRAAIWRVAVVPLCLIAITATMSWVAALILLVAGPLIPLFMALVGMAAKEASSRQLVEIGTMNALMLDRLRGLVDIRLLGAVDQVAGDFTTAADRLRGRTMAVLKIAFLSSAVLELFSALGVAMVAVYVGFGLLGILEFGTWSGPMMLTQGVFILMLAPEFFQPLRDFSTAWHDSATARAIMDEGDAILAEPRGGFIGTGQQARALPGPARVVLDGVTCRGINLPGHIEIAPGETIALTGPSGAGKSTILALIAGLLTPDTGTITVAGQPLNEVTADGWRARIAWVSQQPHFIAGSVRANVAFAGDVTDIAKIHHALTIAAALHVPGHIPGGLDARLGETGYGVSGGEARRLAVARAAFMARDVILADEPTAHLDGETAESVLNGLLHLAKGGATLIVATHDPRVMARLGRQITLTEAL
ncbi:MAG: thiol reductant ABC exporter subunit CydD [Pseudomonadota bacterium]